MRIHSVAISVPLLELEGKAAMDRHWLSSNLVPLCLQALADSELACTNRYLTTTAANDASAAYLECVPFGLSEAQYNMFFSTSSVVSPGLTPNTSHQL